ncbi:MAG TPA: transglycosylase domain-containing protein, partial [Candidatus Paceibacterota bacterium]|nr:transglycosylase domain-containing protein [Candidatus Paceibacterota bacterium]
MISRPTYRRRWLRWWKMAVFLFIGLCFLGAATAAGIIIYFNQTIPTFEEIASRQISQSTKIYDRTGRVLLYEINAGQKRTVVPFEDIPVNLKNATIAIEDERFYQEPAFDWQGILRAIWVNITHGSIRQGGSTITQQLARNAFLTTEQTWTRKIRELILAVRLSQQYTKDQVLGLYLNEVPYGPTIYGVEAASSAFFNKQTKDLTLAESALLAAIPKGPSYYSPWGNHVPELIARQKTILKKMRDLSMITDKDLATALAEPLVFQPQGLGIKAPHFVMAVQDYLVKKYGEDAVRTGGLSVVTTLDWNLQQSAEKAVADGAARNEKLYAGTNAALVAEDPTTGHVLAMVGSRDYFDTKNNG